MKKDFMRVVAFIFLLLFVFAGAVYADFPSLVRVTKDLKVYGMPVSQVEMISTTHALTHSNETLKRYGSQVPYDNLTKTVKVITKKQADGSYLVLTGKAVYERPVYSTANNWKFKWFEEKKKRLMGAGIPTAKDVTPIIVRIMEVEPPLDTFITYADRKNNKKLQARYEAAMAKMKNNMPWYRTREQRKKVYGIYNLRVVPDSVNMIDKTHMEGTVAFTKLEKQSGYRLFLKDMKVKVKLKKVNGTWVLDKTGQHLKKTVVKKIKLTKDELAAMPNLVTGTFSEIYALEVPAGLLEEIKVEEQSSSVEQPSTSKDEPASSEPSKIEIPTEVPKIDVPKISF